jgi:hypothetical protein
MDWYPGGGATIPISRADARPATLDKGEESYDAIIRTTKEEHMDLPRMYPLEEALKAQKSLREAAELGPEQFPIQAFVGMISDEIEALRKRGKSDEEIVSIIQQHSAIRITAQEIAENYASHDERHQHGQ